MVQMRDCEMRSAERGIEPEPPHVGCYGSGVQCAKFFGEIFARLDGHPLPIGWGEGQGEGSSEILQTGLDSLRLTHYRTDSGVCVEVPGADLPERERRAIILGHGPGGLLEHVLHLVRGEIAAGCLLHERDRSDDVRRRHGCARRARVVSKVSEAARYKTAMLEVTRRIEKVQGGPRDGARRDDVRSRRSQRRVELRAP